MRTVSLADMTMRQSGKTSGFSLSFREKIELAKLLDKLGVSVIELSPLSSPKADRLLIKSVASAVRESTVAVSVGLDADQIAPVWDALREAKHPRLQITAPVSAVQMEYLAGKKPAAMLQTLELLTASCRELCGDVEVIMDDATRADPTFLQSAIRAAVSAGATTVTLCDTAGAMLPDQFSEFLSSAYAAAPELAEVRLGVSCSNELSMADACAVAAVRAGASEIKCASHAVSCVSLESIAKILSVKGADHGLSCTVCSTQINRILEQIRRMCRIGRPETSPFDTGVRPGEGMNLTVHDDESAVLSAVAKLGYDLSEEDGAKVFEAFTRIASKKETVSAKELDAIVASAAMQVPPTFRLDSYVITTGNTISATAHLKLQKDGRPVEGVSIGDGPIDAAFLAVEQIAGHHYELDDFQIQAVTEGREAMGEAVVKLRSSGKLYSGRGISTDIVGASIHAYLSALNKIVYEQGSF